MKPTLASSYIHIIDTCTFVAEIAFINIFFEDLSVDSRHIIAYVWRACNNLPIACFTNIQ